MESGGRRVTLMVTQAGSRLLPVVPYEFQHFYSNQVCYGTAYHIGDSSKTLHPAENIVDSPCAVDNQLYLRTDGYQ